MAVSVYSDVGLHYGEGVLSGMSGGCCMTVYDRLTRAAADHLHESFTILAILTIRLYLFGIEE